MCTVVADPLCVCDGGGGGKVKEAQRLMPSLYEIEEFAYLFAVGAKVLSWPSYRPSRENTNILGEV